MKKILIGTAVGNKIPAKTIYHFEKNINYLQENLKHWNSAEAPAGNPKPLLKKPLPVNHIFSVNNHQL